MLLQFADWNRLLQPTLIPAVLMRGTEVRVTSHRSPSSLRQQLISNMVVEIFDELFTEISAKPMLHRSEQVSREGHLSYSVNSKIYDFINSYHGFCKLCEQHFYSCSIPNDINSFFQKHLNSPYHRQQRSAGLCPDDVPMFTWEDWPRSGRCNICEMSGLNAFVISTKFSVAMLMREHVCVWPKEQRETNDKFLRKLSLLRKYCGLKIFKEKFIKTVNGKEVCLLCGVKLPWMKEKAGCHLKSDEHYQKFCLFIWTNFSFAPKDILNGFNLEAVTRSMIAYIPPTLSDYVDLNERETCIIDSNNSDNPYPEDKQNLSFSPRRIEFLLRDINADFVHKNECLLCNVKLSKGHFASPCHQERAASISENSFEPEKYKIYNLNRGKRLLPYAAAIEAFHKLLNDLKMPQTPPNEEESLKLPDFDVPEQVEQFKATLEKKLNSFEEIIVAVDEEKFLCRVCDAFYEELFRQAHVDGDGHKNKVERWNELRENITDERFFEPFVNVKHMTACLICGIIVTPNSFLCHVKNDMHARNLEEYYNLNYPVPISSTFDFRDDWSCWCNICNSPASKKKSFPMFRAILKDVQHHWPCPNAGTFAEDLPNGTEAVSEQDAAAPPGEQEEAQLDLDSVGSAIECIVNLFEERITNLVLDKSMDLIKCVDNSALVKDEEESQSGDQKEETTKDEIDDEEAEYMESDRKGARRKDFSKHVWKKESGVDDEEMYEVLILSGLPKRKKKCKVIFPSFEKFGEIEFLFFDTKSVAVGFREKDIANKAAKAAPVLLQEPKLGVKVSEKNIKDLMTGDDTVLLDRDSVSLFLDPRKLTEFMMQLIFQARKASESPMEAKQEQLVCNMIVNAVMDNFPLCRCYPFGSRLTGLTLNNSDLDVFLDCGGMYEGFKNTTTTSERKLVRTVAKALRKSREVTEIIVVDSARVPIISFLHKTTRLHCDISFKNGLSIQNSLLIKFLVSLDWRVKPLILFMKHWAKLNRMHGPPFFSSYALSMLVINYLEQLQCPVLPTIESLQNSFNGRRLTIGGWDCSINTNIALINKLNNIETLPVLLLGFFDFYSSFNFSKDVVFPLNGKALPRKAFCVEEKDQLPMCFKRHILNVPVPIESLVSQKFPICIIDPFDLSHVLTKSFTQKGLEQFVYLCQMSKNYLISGLTTSSQ